MNYVTCAVCLLRWRTRVPLHRAFVTNNWQCAALAQQGRTRPAAACCCSRGDQLLLKGFKSWFPHLKCRRLHPPITQCPQLKPPHRHGQEAFSYQPHASHPLLQPTVPEGKDRPLPAAGGHQSDTFCFWADSSVF